MMPWIIVFAVSLVLGWLTSVFMRRFGMGAIVCIPIALIGCAMGAVLHQVYNPVVTAGFYGLSLLLCVLALGGGIYAFFLTSSERRI